LRSCKLVRPFHPLRVVQHMPKLWHLATTLIILAAMMRMFSTAVNMFHGSSSTQTPYSNLHELTARDIDLNNFNFSSLANKVRASPKGWISSFRLCHVSACQLLHVIGSV